MRSSFSKTWCCRRDLRQTGQGQQIDHGELEDASAVFGCRFEKEGRALKNAGKGCNGLLMPTSVRFLNPSIGRARPIRQGALQTTSEERNDYLQVTSFVYQPYYAPMMIEARQLDVGQQLESATR